MERGTYDAIDTERPPAVQSLRSKFEKLTAHNSPPSHHRRESAGQQDLLAPDTPSSPRPRASSSNTFPNAPIDTHHLRSSSSSSDLRVSTRRPPPPPPPSRPSKGLSNSPVPPSLPSPLLRPVPAPPRANGSPRISSSNFPSNGTLSTLSSNEQLNLPLSSTKHKFATAPSTPARQAPSSVPFSDTYSGSTSTSNRPPVPPRPAKQTDSYLLQPSLTHSPENIFDVSTSVSTFRTISPFSDDEVPKTTPSAPPALPFRRHPTEQSSSSTQSSESFMNTSESDLSIPSSSTSKSSLPPRPPSRFRTSASPARVDVSLVASPQNMPASPAPPPLPVRRSTIAPAEETCRPPLPSTSRPSLVMPLHIASPDSPSTSSPVGERKPLGSARLPPPPTRTIALGDKLPPARRPPSPSSDEDSGDEDDAKVQLVDTLPDRSRSSRRPPVLSFRDAHAEPNIQVHAFSGVASVAGTTAVVAHHSHIKIYDLAMSDIPIYALEMKDIALKDAKVTSMEFRPSAKRADRGFVVWLGTKEGHLFELDARLGIVIDAKYSAHLHSVTHIFRHGRSMVTTDDSGKVLVFSPDSASGADITLSQTQPKVARIAEKLDFVKMVGGKLWTAARMDQQVLTGLLKIPVIRVYDIFTPSNLTRSVVPMEHVGAVTSATIVSTLPDMVFVGHEAGAISIWTMSTDDGFPRCLEVMRVSTSDVMCVEGVNDRLWAGARNGMISAFDVTQKPWIVTNCWTAHPGLPVLRMSVDHYGIDKIGRLCVISIGRDEQLKLWDGLLGLDWIDEELSKQEPMFSRTRDLKMLIVSWNCDAARPDSLTGDPANLSFLGDILRSVDSPDIVSFGFQEVIDLESRKIAAKNVLLASKKKIEDGGLSEKVTTAYRKWYDRLALALRQNMPLGEPYVVIHSESLVGLFSCIMIKNSERADLRDVSITTVKRGMGGRYGNKGGIITRFLVDDSSVCLINCHLAAGQNAVRQRNADVAAILEEKTLFPETSYPYAYVGGGDGTMVLDHEIVLVNGDMNYRIDHRRDAIISAIRSGDYSSLLAHDQLLREIKFNRACRFRGFSEGPLTFAPTYKYDPRTDEYDSSEKRRSPAWCDRVLWRSRDPERIQQLHYQRYEANVSDHRPISAAFIVTVKSINHDVRQQVKAHVQVGWVEEQARLLGVAKQFYVQQALI